MRFEVNKLVIDVDVEKSRWGLPLWIEVARFGSGNSWFLSLSIFCIHLDITHYGLPKEEDEYDVLA